MVFFPRHVAHVPLRAVSTVMNHMQNYEGQRKNGSKGEEVGMV